MVKHKLHHRLRAGVVFSSPLYKALKTPCAAGIERAASIDEKSHF